MNNSRPPIITQVCRESREVALKNAAFRGNHVDDDPSGPGWLSWTSISDSWFTHGTDIVHLNWYPAYNIEFAETGNPIPVLLAEPAKGIAASITANLVLPSHFDLEDGCCVGSHYHGKYDTFKLLALRSEYLVTMNIIHLHIGREQATRSGLFGRLGEERVKLVDPADRETMRKYYELWIAGPKEDQEPAAFFDIALSTELFLNRIEKWSDEVTAL